MNTCLSAHYYELNEKRKLLEVVRIQLKREFIGLDKVIDQVIELSSAWYLFPNLQERPTVINLWGLTGTGKTSLVKRFAQLIDYEKKYFRFDMKSERSALGLDDIDEVNRSSGNNFMILGLDEFQNIPSSKNQTEGLWDLLDSGKLEYNSYSRYYYRISNIRHKLEDALKHGVKVLDGQVVYGLSTYSKIVEDDLEPKVDDELVWFFPYHSYDELCDLNPERFSAIWQVREALSELDGPATIAFLDKILSEFEKPRVLDCSYSLIFVMGNLDVAYTMARDFNPDLSADEFHMLSQKITISHIKNALLLLDFRSEQISRLGNNHIIYPAFSSDSYRRIIQKEVERVRKSFKSKYGIQLEFHPSLTDLIYKEGVYPTQGTRPVFSTVNQILTSKLGIIVSEMVLNQLNCTKVNVRARENNIVIEYVRRKTLLHFIEIPQQLNLESLRKNRNDDSQAISAVHESGHGVLSMVLLNTIPNSIYSVTAEAGMGGFIHTRMNWEYVSRKQVLLQLAMMLGGYAAEQLVFGRDHMTAGSSSDLEQASGFAARMIKSCGLGKTHFTYQVASPQTNYLVWDREMKVNEEIKTLLEEALTLAHQTLEEQEKLLLQMAAHLADNRSMNQEIAREMLKTYAVGNPIEEIIENGDHLFYRKALMNRKNKLEGREQIPGKIKHLSSITLNISNNERNTQSH
jgi:cell division protease FtsH